MQQGGVGPPPGVRRPGRGRGAPEACKCPECGHEEPHLPRKPCRERRCPECGTPMVRK